MAASFISSPGTQFGPCIEPCHHTDCHALRLVAESSCTYCHEPIGYEKRYYHLGENAVDETNIYAHAVCVDEALEAGRNNRKDLIV